MPIIAVHLFVFYFGILGRRDTPPVGLASLCGGGHIGRGSHQDGPAVALLLRHCAPPLLPFLFIFNTELLLIDVGWLQGGFVFVISTVAMLLFAAATQGWFLTRNRIYETALLLLVAFSLFRPGYWMDQIVPPFEELAPAAIEDAAMRVEPGQSIRLYVDGLDVLGDPISFVGVLPVGEGDSGKDRLVASGLQHIERDGDVIVDNVGFDSPAKNAGFDWDQKITSILVPTDPPSKYLIYFPTLLVLGLVIVLQRGRARKASS